MPARVRSRYRTPGLVAAALAVLSLAYWLTRSRDPLPDFPRLMLWAWERPEDLRFLHADSAGIAFVAKTIRVDGATITALPRLQPLQFPKGAALMAVVRIESAGHALGTRADVIREIRATLNLPRVRALQIHFYPRQSERPWYAALLRELKPALPSALPLTIAALESWCDGDTWIRDLPIDDAVPMLFQMGQNESIPSDFSLSICRNSLGLSTSEPPPRIPHGRRLYFFNPKPWTADAFQSIMGKANRLR